MFLSNFDGHLYAEIKNQLKISEKDSVKNQNSKLIWTKNL